MVLWVYRMFLAGASHDPQIGAYLASEVVVLLVYIYY